MTEYIPIQQDARNRYLQTSSYGRPENPFPPDAPAPHVTRLSYGSTLANRPSSNLGRYPNAGLRPPSHLYGPRPTPSGNNAVLPPVDGEPPHNNLSPPTRPWASPVKYDSGFPSPTSPPPGRAAPPTYIDPPTQDRSWVSVFPDGQRRFGTPGPPTEVDQHSEERSNSTQRDSDAGSEPEQFVLSDHGSEPEEAEEITVDQNEAVYQPPVADATAPDSPYQWDDGGGAVYTPPAKEKKSIGFPFVGGFKFMSKLRKRPKHAPLEPQHPPSPPPLQPERPIEIVPSSPSPSIPAPATSTPLRKPALTPLQPPQPLTQPTMSRQDQKKPAAWYTPSRGPGSTVPGPSFPVPEARIELPISDEPRDSSASSSGTSKSSHFGPLNAGGPDIIAALPNPHESQLVTADPNAFATPIHITPQAAPDYDRMSQSDSQSDSYGDSFMSHLYHLGQFLKDLFQLPFIGKFKTAEYDPGTSWRAHNSKAPKSWYTQPGQAKIDLLATPTASRPPRRFKSSRPPRARQYHNRDRDRHHHHHHHHKQASSYSRPRHRYQHFSPPSSMDAATAIRPARTPMSATSEGVMPTSPGASSHGRGNQSIAYSYYGSQPMYVYPAQMPVVSRGMETTRSTKAERRPTMPIYMMAVPPTFGKHRSNRHHHHHHPPSSPR